MSARVTREKVCDYTEARCIAPQDHQSLHHTTFPRRGTKASYPIEAWKMVTK